MSLCPRRSLRFTWWKKKSYVRTNWAAPAEEGRSTQPALWVGFLNAAGEVCGKTSTTTGETGSIARENLCLIVCELRGFISEDLAQRLTPASQSTDAPESDCSFSVKSPSGLRIQPRASPIGNKTFPYLCVTRNCAGDQKQTPIDALTLLKTELALLTLRLYYIGELILSLCLSHSLVAVEIKVGFFTLKQVIEEIPLSCRRLQIVYWILPPLQSR